MRVRKARETDLDGIIRLYACLHPHHVTEPHFETECSWRKIVHSRISTVFVAELDAQLVSTCMVAVLPSFAKGGRPIGVIEHVVTLEEFRGKGFARETMSAAISYAWRRSCGKLLLLSGASRQGAHELYESLGFDGNVERGFVLKAPDASSSSHVDSYVRGSSVATGVASCGDGAKRSDRNFKSISPHRALASKD